jgi:hypothetical protein
MTLRRISVGDRLRYRLDERDWHYHATAAAALHCSSIIGLSAIVAAKAALLPGSVAAQQKPLKDQLVGTWTLVSFEDINPNGTKKQYLGANPRGILMLDAGGRYAAMFGPSDRPKLKGSRAEATQRNFMRRSGRSPLVLARGRSTKRTRPSFDELRGLLSQTVRDRRSWASLPVYQLGQSDRVMRSSVWLGMN